MPSFSQFKPVTHCIFDMDGLLLDTEFIYEKSIRAICESFGIDYRWDVRMKVMGTTEQQTAQTVITELNVPLTVTEFLHRLDDLVRDEFKQLNLMKGAKRLLYHLHEAKVPFCLATSSGREMAKIKMSSHSELFKLFSHYVMGSTDPEVKVGKPAPDIFLIAASRFQDKPDPSKCLVFEDSPNGVKSAIAAGKTLMQSSFVVFFIFIHIYFISFKNKRYASSNGARHNDFTGEKNRGNYCPGFIGTISTRAFRFT